MRSYCVCIKLNISFLAIKRDLLHAELTQITSEKSPQTSAVITIENIEFKIKPKMELNKAYNWYFLYIAQYKSNVKASIITRMKNGRIEFHQSFQFEGNPSDLEVNISLYALSLRTTVNIF